MYICFRKSRPLSRQQCIVYLFGFEQSPCLEQIQSLIIGHAWTLCDQIRALLEKVSGFIQPFRCEQVCPKVYQQTLVSSSLFVERLEFFDCLVASIECPQSHGSRNPSTHDDVSLWNSLLPFLCYDRIVNLKSYGG